MYVIYSNTKLNYVTNLISLLSPKQESVAQIVIYLVIKCMDTLFPTVTQQQKQVEWVLY